MSYSHLQAQDKVKMIELLASKGVRVNEKDNQGQTPLQLACNHSESRGQEMVIQALLSQSGIKVDVCIKIDISPKPNFGGFVVFVVSIFGRICFILFVLAF